MQRVFRMNMRSIIIICFWLAACLWCSCNDKETPDKPAYGYNKQQAINLFPEQLANNDEAKNDLSFEEAVTRSGLVLYTSKLILIDSSFQRSLLPVYLYKASQGMQIKPQKQTAQNNAFLFLSRKKLFNGKQFPDSVYLFLRTIENNKILRDKINIQYQWVDNAPLVTR